MGVDAKQALNNLIDNKKVYLREPITDNYGRIMALVYTDKILVNEVMLKAGLAAYKRQGGSETEKMKAASDYARDNKIGIFSEKCYQTIPPNPKCPIKGNYDEAKNRKVYFRPDCGYYALVAVELYQGDNWYCTEKEAQKAGFTKSDSCQ
jgi:hypothetical protein